MGAQSSQGELLVLPLEQEISPCLAKVVETSALETFKVRLGEGRL